MTITLGANPDYASEGFYKEHIQEDGSRVERLFRVSRDGAPCMQSLLRGLCITGFWTAAGIHFSIGWFWVFATSRSAGRQVSQLWCLLQDASAAGIKVTRKSMGCRELKDKMLLGSTLVIALVDKTRLAGHAGVAAGHKAVSLGMSCAHDDCSWVHR